MRVASRFAGGSDPAATSPETGGKHRREALDDAVDVLPVAPPPSVSAEHLRPLGPASGPLLSAPEEQVGRFDGHNRLDAVLGTIRDQAEAHDALAGESDQLREHLMAPMGTDVAERAAEIERVQAQLQERLAAVEAELARVEQQTAQATAYLQAVQTESAKLRDLAGEVRADLDALSRYLEPHADAAGTAAASALLPDGIESPIAAATQAMLNWAQDRLGRLQFATVAAAELQARWSAATARDWAGKSDAVLLARAFEPHGIGMEPDVRFGGPAATDHMPVVLFRQAADSISTPGDEYAAAVMLIQLSASVASTDGRLAPAERDVLELRVILAPGLTDSERQRLRAHLMWVLAEPPAFEALCKHVNQLPEAQRRDVRDLLWALAGSDGNVAQTKTDRLTRRFDALGLSRPEVDGQLYATDDEDLARLRTAGAPSRPYAIPRTQPEEHHNVATVVLDPQLIEARMAESARAASYLAQIFADDDTSAQPTVSSVPDVREGQNDGAVGLDAPHRTFLGKLADQPSWSRADLEAIAVQFGLLPDGALEIINEVAFETVGEPVWEGTDPIEINPYVLKEILG